MHPIIELKLLENELKIAVFTVEFEILSFLLQQGRAGIEDVRKNVRGSPGTVSSKIRNLVATGLVVRQSSQDDRRVSHYELSAYGQTLMDPTGSFASSVDLTVAT